jgi:C4-dicarboxylate-specific signal transduction histidine kinase
VLALTAFDLRRRGVTLVTRLDPRLPAVTGDRVQLQQVPLNLFVNGCEAMSSVPADERRLTGATGPEEDGMVQLTLEDCGTGIPKGELDQILEPFPDRQEKWTGPRDLPDDRRGSRGGTLGHK